MYCPGKYFMKARPIGIIISQHTVYEAIINMYLVHTVSSCYNGEDGDALPV